MKKTEKLNTAQLSTIMEVMDLKKSIRNMKIAIYAILIGLVVSVSLIWEVINAITA